MNIDIKETPEDFLKSVQDLYPGDIFLVNRDNMEVKGETHHVTQQLFFFIYSNGLKMYIYIRILPWILTAPVFITTRQKRSQMYSKRMSEL